MTAISFTLGSSQRPAATEGLAFTDGHHSETHNYRPACARTGLAASRRPSLVVQKIYRVGGVPNDFGACDDEDFRALRALRYWRRGRVIP